MATENENLNKLFYPELMNTEELLAILTKRCVLSPANLTNSREQLIDIFNRVVMPLEQRTCKETSRGRLLNNTRSVPNGIKRTSTENKSLNETNSAKLTLQESKKIKTTELQLNNRSNKRILSTETEHSLPPKRARQKITWP